MRSRILSRLLLPLLLLFLSPALHGQALDKQAASLAWTPANVAQYSVSLRLGEQYKNFVNSKAWTRLMNLDGVQDALKIVNNADGPFKFLHEKHFKDAMAIVGEMMSRELCVLSGENLADFISLMQSIQGANQLAPLAELLQGGGGGDQNLARTRAVLQALNHERDKLMIPDCLIGYRLETAARAGEVRKYYDDLLAQVVEAVPAFKGRLKKVTIADKEWTTLTLDGSMVPWDAIPWNDLESQPGEFKQLVQKLKDVKLTISLGTRDDFLLLSLGTGSTIIRSLGGPNRLIDRDELKPLAKFADRKLTSISYTSKTLAAKVATQKEDIEGMFQMVETGLDQLGLSKEEKQKIRKDLKELAKELKTALPEAGASLSFSFSTDRAFESYAYDWTRYPGTPDPKPLTILQHVGGDPLFVTAGRVGDRADSYKSMVKWIKLADGYVDELALPRLPEEQQKHVKLVLDLVRPFGKAIDTITQQRLLPALKDGQEALVLDAKLTSKSWIPLLGVGDKALPLPEPVMVLGVSDAEALIKGLKEYREAANKMLKDAAQLGGMEIQIPAAKEMKVKDGVVFWHPLGEMLGLDEQLKLSAAIGTKAAAFGISTETTTRMLKPTAFKGTGPLAKADRPLLSASSINGEAMMKALTPWVEMVSERYIDLVVDEKEQKDRIRKHVSTVMEVLGVFRSSSSATYPEGKATVTHSETIVRDLEK